MGHDGAEIKLFGGTANSVVSGRSCWARLLKTCDDHGPQPEADLLELMLN